MNHRSIIFFSSIKIPRTAVWLLGAVLLFVTLQHCAYFNTYYNANQYFQQAVKEYNTLPEGAAITATLRKKLDAVIEKTDAIQTLYPTSRWVENALYLNARATYYKGDYTFARKKFEEFFTRYPQSRLESEALIWYGRTLWKLNEREAAFFQWNRALRKIQDENLLSELYQSIAELYANSNRIDSAIAYYHKVTRTAPNLTLAANAQYQIADLFNKNRDYPQAIQNLKKVSEFLPDQSLKNKVQLLLIKIYRQAQQYDEAVAIINERLNDEANQAIWGELELQLGMLYLDKGDYESAVSRFNNITQKYKGKPVAAEAYYHLAKLSIDYFHDYERAQTQFESVIKEDSKSPFANEARMRAAEIKRFLGIKKRLEALAKQIADIEKARSQVSDTTLTKFASSSDPQEVKKAFEKQATQRKGIDTAAVYADYYNQLFELGESFYFSFGAVDSALLYYKLLADGRYLNQIRDKALFCYYRLLQEKQAANADSVKNELLKNYPDSPYTAHLLGRSMLLKTTEQKAQELFDKAEAYRESNLDSALYFYQKVADSYPETSIGEKCVMNVAFIYHHQLYDLERALEWYQKFTNAYPKSSYSAQFRATFEQLKRIKTELENQSSNQEATPGTTESPSSTVAAPLKDEESEK